jgi:hypothetical protein
MLSFLASEEKVNVVFAHDSLLYIDNLSEKGFLQKMMKKIPHHATVEEANNWALAYNTNKFEKWPKAFIDQLNEKLSENENPPFFEMGNTKTEYTMSVNPSWMYFGYDAGIIDRPAKVTLQINFYKTKDPSNIIFSTEISRAMAKYNKQEGDGEGAGPSLNRMRKAYIKAAYKLAQAFKRIVD